MIGHPLMTDLPQWLEAVWLQRYLDRLLDDQETAWFESYAMSRPELMNAIDADNDLRDAVALLPAEAQAVSQHLAANDAPADTRSNRGPWFAPMAQAAGLVLALFAGGWLNSRLNPPEQLPMVIASPTRLVMDTPRSGADAEALVQPGNADSSYVLIEVAIPVGAHKVRLRDREGRAVSLTVSSEGFASFLLHKSVIESGDTGTLEYERAGETVVLEASYLIKNLGG